MEAVDILKNAVAACAPPPPLTVSEWADTYRYIAGGKSPFPGKWSTARTPYLREVMDCITDGRVEQIVLMKPTRIGGTEVINNAIGYYIHYDPCQMLYVQTSIEEGEKYSDEILMPMIEATPVLAERVERQVYGRKATQKKRHKSFSGGNIAIVGAKSPKGFRMVSKRVVICDDVDGYEPNKEGDPIELAEGRAKDYWNKKIFKVSNPTTAGVSRIEAAFKQSDQRFRWVPCPDCGEFQILKFGGKDSKYGLKWETPDGEDVWYECKYCHKQIWEYNKDNMDKAGEWRAKGEFRGVAGFHLNPFLCAWHPWLDIKKKFLSSKGDPSKLYVFVTQWLGEVWSDEKGKRITEEALLARRENYPAPVPAGVLIITCAVDVMDHHLECKMVGWGPGEEFWLIEYKIINGAFIEAKIQAELDEFIFKTYKHESVGEIIGVRRTCIDTGGHYTAQVYEYVKAREYRGVTAVHGSNQMKADILDGPMRVNKGSGAKYQRVGTVACKDTLYGRLRLGKDKIGPGYMHFPMTIDKAYFEGLLSEKVVITSSRQRRYDVMPGRKNEPVDLHNYALVALRLENVDWERLKREGPGRQQLTLKVFKPYQRYRHVDGNIKLNPKLPILVCCDFKNPMTWVLAQTNKKRVWVFDEIVIRNADTLQMSVEVMKRYGGHRPGCIVYGPAIGAVSSGVSKSEYAAMIDFGLGQQRYKRVEPLQGDLINATNNMLENLAGEARLTVSPECILLNKDLEICIYDDNKEIERIEFGRGNAFDALANLIHYEFPLRSARPNPAKRFYK